ncbi:unnamed protein product [Cyclocybe aegerita]|uniref:Uncharacterized protein n=1 Tax=Cyclocybe aegerita TaxID=1973307 RepID=A0A8S0W9Z8_CYCAE|nr:unnamed protein product [Cyclocybe aegerita]
MSSIPLAHAARFIEFGTPFPTVPLAHGTSTLHTSILVLHTSILVLQSCVLILTKAAPSSSKAAPSSSSSSSSSSSRAHTTYHAHRSCEPWAIWNPGHPGVPGETTIYDTSETIVHAIVPLNGGFLLKTLAISIDPYLRGLMGGTHPEAWEVGQP